ncbi:hypothetical protein KXV27_004772 [Aspergillus fumigatus]|nr:hypothetical protein KXX48_004744 [Aspergillus fumigatus]KAH1523994.1 hypothetical protein KXX18_005540 [Aspergillus fumigatus]KAH1714239.1 hypothetical protein KXX60_004280 [Aspergillus fumigatus]KAH3048154.1 hypothetical protein KXV27_004772 [Aspergillus fumigatus]
MSFNFGRRLYTSIWDTAHPLLVRELRNSRMTFFFESPSTGNWFRRFLFNTHARKISSLPPRTRHITKRFASGSFFMLGISPSPCAVEAGTSCAISPEKFVSQSHLLDRKFVCASLYTWKRGLHTTKDDDGLKSEQSNELLTNDSNTSPSPSRETADSDTRSGTMKSQEEHIEGFTSRHIMNRLPHMSHLHRPTKEELLAAANGFWSRLKVRFKWFSIRSVRPFNFDEITALFSWVLLGHVVWIVLGTTTFFSLLIIAINTVLAQETLAGWVGNYLTKSSGVKVVFESAIVPKWKDGVITFKNVFVSRRPGQGTGHVSKGSSKTAAAVAAAAALSGSSSPEPFSDQQSIPDEEDTNYTQFDLSIETVNVTLSFTKWINGKGLLRDVEVKGIRGVVDRRSVHWSDDHLDPKSYRHEHHPGDFEIDSFKMSDVLVTVYQPGNFRPFSWLLYDFMSANMMTGSFDNSLFTIHPRQSHSFASAEMDNKIEADGKPSTWKKHSRIRIDGLNIDHLNRGVQGPFSWIYEGTVDIVADIMFPAENDESLAQVMAGLYDRLEATVISNQYQEPDSRRQPGMDGTASSDDKRFLVTDLRLQLNNVRAVVPLFNRDLSYINNALIRPIVAYINSRRTFIPIHCRLVKRLADFDGSWTTFDSGLMDDLSAAVYDAFARDVVDEQARKRRFKKVGFWSLQLAAQAIFMGMAGNIA